MDMETYGYLFYSLHVVGSSRIIEICPWIIIRSHDIIDLGYSSKMESDKIIYRRYTEVATTPLHSPRCTVWAAISARGIIGPMFLEEFEATVTVTKERYVEVLEAFKSELYALYPSLMNRFWFQQDGASCHTSKMSRDWLKKNFRRRVISLILSGRPIAQT